MGKPKWVPHNNDENVTLFMNKFIVLLWVVIPMFIIVFVFGDIAANAFNVN